MEKHYLTVDQALSVLPDGDTIHCFVSGGMLLGADWDRADVENYIQSAETREIGGKMCRSMGHGLAVYGKGGMKFFEANENKLIKIEKGE